MRKVKILALVLFLGVATIGCSDFLSEMPDNRTEIDTPAKAKQLLIAAYPNATFGLFAEEMTDNMVDTGIMQATNRSSEFNFTWEVNEEEGTDTPKYYWNASYRAIAQANAALESLKSLEEEYANKPSKSGLEQIKAEALLTRAYNHFMLVSLWSKAYNPATAENDLGIPYVTKSETELIVQYQRGTVAEVYRMIEADIVEGLKGIKNATFNSPSIAKFHFSEASARAFAARFYLYKGEFDKVLEYSNNLPELPIGLLRDVASSSSRDRVQNEAYYTRPELPTNLLISTVMSRRGRITGGNRFTFTNAVAARGLLGPQSHPLDLPWNYPTANFSYNDRLYVPKFRESFQVTDFTNQTGYPHTTFVLFSNDMLYLDRIEAMIFSNRIEEAARMLEYFIWTRTDYSRTNVSSARPEQLVGNINYKGFEEFYSVAVDLYQPIQQLNKEQGVMLAALAETRRRESYEEGYRWFDIKRYNLELTHTLKTGQVYELKRNDPKYQLQIPLNVIDSGITPNPR